MSLCRFCGEKAGILKKEHKQCRQIYEVGKSKLNKIITDLLLGQRVKEEDIEPISDICDKSFINEDERNSIIRNSMELSIGTLKRAEELDMLRLRIDNLYIISKLFDISIYSLDISKIKFTIGHFILLYLRGDKDLENIRECINLIKDKLSIDSCSNEKYILDALNNSIVSMLDDDLLSSEEEKRFLSVVNVFDIEQDKLNSLSNYEKLVKAGVLRDVIEGIISTRIRIDGSLPFNLQKSEQIIWVFSEVKYYEVKTKVKYVGGSSGMSVKVMKGVYLRTSSYKGRPIEYSETTLIGQGLMGITQKHIYFSSPQKSFRVPFSKIVTYEPYSDGIGIQRDAQTAKPQIFVTGDGWFTNNLIKNVSANF